MLVVQLHSHLKKIQFGRILLVAFLVGFCAHRLAFNILFEVELYKADERHVTSTEYIKQRELIWNLK